MDSVSFGGKKYLVDGLGFLEDSDQWDEGFAEAMAPQLDIEGGLTEKHWAVIRYIRGYFEDSGDCPLVFSTCRANHLSLRDLESLFPTGYLRGACKLAGITYRNRLVNYYGEPSHVRITRAEGRGPPPIPQPSPTGREKVYRIDAFGFLVDPREWDERFAAIRAWEMKVPGGLTERHWQVLDFLRRTFEEKGIVPTVVECCTELGLGLEDLEGLFPDGYHRGAVKLAGLCIKPGAGSSG